MREQDQHVPIRRAQRGSYSLYLLQEGDWVMPELLTSVDEPKVMKVLAQELPDLVMRSISSCKVSE